MKVKPNFLILIAGDNDEDSRLFTDAVKKVHRRCEVRAFPDGATLLDYLLRRGEYTDPGTAPRPDVLLLELNLPGGSGRQVLTEIKTTAQLRTIPLVVWTSSTDDRDISWSYEHGASAYMVKPSEPGGLLDSARALCDYWLRMAVLPQENCGKSATGRAAAGRRTSLIRARRL